MMDSNVQPLVKNYLVTQVTVIQRKPPWYWRMVGRVYWKGWVIEASLVDAIGNKRAASTLPALSAPTPVLISNATSEAIQLALDKFPRATQ